MCGYETKKSLKRHGSWHRLLRQGIHRTSRHLKEHRHIVYTTMLIEGTPNLYLADINQQAEQMFHRLIEEMAQKQGVTEQLKAEQPMEWIGLMNNIQACAREVVNHDIIYN